MLTTDTVDTDTVDTDTVDTTDTLTDTDTTEARGPLKPKLHPRLMLTTDTVDTTVMDTDTVDTDTVDTVVDTIMVELLLKQTNPLNYNCQDQVTRNSFNLATMQKLPPPLFFFKHENSLFFPIELEILSIWLQCKNSLPPYFFLNMKIPSFFQLNSKFFQFGYNAKTPSPLIFF